MDNAGQQLIFQVWIESTQSFSEKRYLLIQSMLGKDFIWLRKLPKMLGVERQSEKIAIGSFARVLGKKMELLEKCLLNLKVFLVSISIVTLGKHLLGLNYIIEYRIKMILAKIFNP